MSTAVDITSGQGTNPWDGDRIEIDEAEMETVSKHVIALDQIKERLDQWATKLTYGR